VSATHPMPSARRRPIPGMASPPIPDAPPAAGAVAEATAGAQEEPEVRARRRRSRAPRRSTSKPAAQRAGAGEKRTSERRPAADYASTRLVNFRIPVDLHDRFRALVREAEDRHPRLRKQSLTELLIALLEEGPETADEVAELIRRKRLAEHEER
jgi:hypothetical protein